jgi:hypothetical protein
MGRTLALAILLLLGCSETPEKAGGPPLASPGTPAVTEEYSFEQLSPPVGPHGEIRWPKDADRVRFAYRIVPRRTGWAGSWNVAEEDRVRGVVLLAPQSDGRGRLSPLTGTAILADRILAPDDWTARRAEWMGGEVLWFRAESGDLPPEGAVFGLEIEKGDGWPNDHSGTYTCLAALTGDGALPTADDGTPAALHNIVGREPGSNVVWSWFRQAREPPSDGMSDPPPICLPVGEES